VLSELGEGKEKPRVERAAGDTQKEKDTGGMKTLSSYQVGEKKERPLIRLAKATCRGSIGGPSLKKKSEALALSWEKGKGSNLHSLKCAQKGNLARTKAP